MSETWIQRARVLMQSRGISQEDLAVSLSCTRGAVGHYLSGRRTPSLEQLIHIAEALQTDPAWLVFGHETAGIGETGEAYLNHRDAVPLAAEIGTNGNHTDVVHFPLPAITANSYAVLIHSNDYEPRIHSGEAVLADPDSNPEPGDEVLILYKDHSAGLHTLVKTSRDRITVDNIVGEKRLRSLANTEYLSIHRIAAIYQPEHC